MRAREPVPRPCCTGAHAGRKRPRLLQEALSIEQAISRVVLRLSDIQITALADTCAPLGEPSSTITASMAGAGVAATEAVAKLCAAWSASPGLTGAGVALALRTA